MTIPPDTGSSAAAFRVVAFGDSTTAPRAGLTVYADRLTAALREAGVAAQVFNAGKGGHNTNHAMERFDRDVLARDPHVVIIQFGINDSAWDVRKTPPPTGPRVAIEQYEANLVHFVRAIKDRGATPILMTPNAMCWSPKMLEVCGRPPYRTDDPDGFNIFLRQYATIIRRVAAAEGVTLVDVLAAYDAHAAKPGHSIAELLLDGQHPNNAGQQLVTDLLKPLVLKEAGKR